MQRNSYESSKWLPVRWAETWLGGVIISFFAVWLCSSRLHITWIIFKCMLFLKETITKQSLYNLTQRSIHIINKQTIKGECSFMRDTWVLEGRMHGSINCVTNPQLGPSPSGSLTRKMWCDGFCFRREPCYSAVPLFPPVGWDFHRIEALGTAALLHRRHCGFTLPVSETTQGSSKRGPQGGRGREAGLRGCRPSHLAACFLVRNR